MRLRFFILIGLWTSATPASAAAEVFAPQRRQETPVPFRKVLNSFTQVRHELLNLIGGAKKRIWLTTNYLTDGEIVTALYIANYRKLDVQVLLGAQKATGYMSRLNYLKKQNTPVFIKPRDFRFSHASGILIDDRLYTINSDLDFKTRQSQFAINLVRPQESRAFSEEFGKAVGLAIPAIPSPTPAVGRPRGGRPAKEWTQPAKQHLTSGGTRPQYTGDKDGSYNYNKSKTGYKREEGIPRKLPKAPIYLLKGQGQKVEDTDPRAID